MLSHIIYIQKRLMISFDYQSNILHQRIIVILSKSIFLFKMQDIIGGVSLGKKIIGIFLYHWNFECGSLTWQCQVFRQKLYLPSWLLGSSFLSFPFPSLVLGDSVYSCSLLNCSFSDSFPITSTWSVRMCACFWGLTLKSPCAAARPIQVPARGHFPFSEVGGRRLGSSW